MKLSVVIPVYNVEKYLQDCIDSLLAQTYSDCEFIFVNDKSTDSCLDILYHNELKFPEKIKVIASEENRCQGGARNLGIQQAKGEYIGFVDGDDMVIPDMFMVMCKEAEKIGADAVFIKYAEVPNGFQCADISSFDGKELICWNKKLLDCNGKYLSDKDRMNLIAYPVGGVCCGIWKRDLIIEHNIFFPEQVKYEDNYWLSVITLYLGKVAFVDQIGYLYRKSPTSTTHTNNAMHHFDRLAVERELQSKVKSLNMYEKYKEGMDYIFIVRYIFGSYWLFLSRFENPPVKVMRDLIKELKKEKHNYYKNVYYKELTPTKMKLMNRAVYCFPQIVIVVYRLLLKMCRIIRR